MLNPADIDKELGHAATSMLASASWAFAKLTLSHWDNVCTHVQTDIHDIHTCVYICIYRFNVKPIYIYIYICPLPRKNGIVIKEADLPLHLRGMTMGGEGSSTSS